MQVPQAKQASEGSVLEQALDWVDEGRGVALATVVETWGSAPRPRGAQLAVRDDGLFVGSVSGGCVEGKVVEAAQMAMKDRAHRLLEFGVAHEEAWEVGLACGGTIQIYVQPVGASLGREVLAEIRRATVDKRAIVLLTPLDGGTVRTWAPGAVNGPPELLGGGAELRAAAERALATDDAMRVDTAGGSVFVQALNPPLVLVIVGAVHIAESLSQIAGLLGYEVVLVDPRGSFARAERWPGITVKSDWPDEVLAAMKLDHRTAVVTLTHDPKIDDPALESALRSPAFYIGALGSGKTQASRLLRLGESGFPPEALARIHGPVGLKIGARSPGEIAVSIAAQMTEARRGAGRSAAPTVAAGRASARATKEAQPA